MNTKIITIFAAIIGVACGSYEYTPSNPVPTAVAADFPRYAYTYGVHDSVTGDKKSQFEIRRGDVVQGEYSLNDPDGYKRTVKYTSDGVNGFKAVVDRKPIKKATPVVVKTVTPVAAPVVVRKAAPLTYIRSPVYNAYATRAVVHSVPVTYGAPAGIRHAPLTYLTQSSSKSSVNANLWPVRYQSPSFYYL